MTTAEKQTAYKRDVLKETEYIRLVGREVAKAFACPEKVREVESKHKKDIEFDYDNYGHGEDGEWVRLNTNDVYLFVYKNGGTLYQLDPFGAYGAELVEKETYDDFVKAVTECDISADVLDYVFYCE